MRRKDKEISDIATIEEIIRKASVCRVALCDDGRPYVVPLCFGYKDKTLYFHCASEGKKLDTLRKNNNVCFEIDIDYELIKTKEACKCGIKYQSVIGFGKATFIEDIESKREAFDIITRNYYDASFEYPAEAIKNTVIIRVEIESMTGKKSGY